VKRDVTRVRRKRKAGLGRRGNEYIWKKCVEQGWVQNGEYNRRKIK
jgi:hypothetical protein